MALTPAAVAHALTGSEWERQRTKLMQRIVLTVEGNAKVATPVLTGNLRRSITSRVEAAGTRGVVGTNVIYARVVHDGLAGTRRVPKPFLEDGLAASRDTIDRLLTEAGDAFFKNVARG